MDGRIHGGFMAQGGSEGEGKGEGIGFEFARRMRKKVRGEYRF